ncbi:HAD family hydrolase [Aliifodinibius sp. S!AR15-10]|uniref:HAD family hydrolase n=1 Tax=Aliifodinibius sp. S!AR15-10 TaxID=2950437 RepID=UPI002856A420|nr:HAD family hydrolase [Aliifodinibius sp. S!AR15-10]MDR8392026.1 HAD family hydrolase [Aliifodinibius sp. S!AR15-10]
MTQQNTMITIDFWNTLVKAETGGKVRRKVRIQALRNIAEKYDEELNLDDIDVAKRKASKEFDEIWFNEQRTPTTKELVDTIITHLDLPASQKEKEYLVEQFEESLWEGPPELTDDAKEVIEKLASIYPLGLISDTMYSPGRVLRRYLESLGILDCFDGFVFSDETGYSKPNPNAFTQLLEKNSCNVAESWHIGDLLETDIKGAKSLGMKAILFTGHSNGRYNKEIEIDAEPDHICNSWSEIAQILL